MPKKDSSYNNAGADVSMEVMGSLLHSVEARFNFLHRHSGDQRDAALFPCAEYRRIDDLLSDAARFNGQRPLNLGVFLDTFDDILNRVLERRL